MFSSAADLNKDFLELKKQIDQLGLYRKTPGVILLGWLYNVSIALGGLALFVFAEPLWLRIPGIIISTLGSMGLATNGHSAGHLSYSTNKWVNLFFVNFNFPLFLMISSTYYRTLHNKVHHLNPNMAGYDPDIDLMPFFALNEDEINGAGPIGSFYYRHLQGFVFPLILPLIGLNMQLKSWLFLIYDPRGRNRERYLDLGAMFLHPVLWIALPMLFFPPSDVIGVYALRVALMGFAMFIVIGPAHFPGECLAIDRSLHGQLHFCVRQTFPSMTFRTGFIGKMLCNGAEYQIEHHLFPQISHFSYKKIQPLVREFCAKHRLPYNECGWGPAIWKSYVAFFKPKPVMRSVEELARTVSR